MKKAFLFIALVTMGAMAAQAQGGGGGFQRRTPEERTKRVVDTLTTVFKLDQAQQTQVQTVFLDYNKAADKLREGMQQGTPPDRSQFEKIMTERDEKLKKVLTADQFKKYKDDIEPNMRMSRRQGGNRQ